MSLARAPQAYDRADQDRLRLELDKRDAQSRKRGQDVVIVGSERLILYSPDGSAFQIVVANDGTLSTVPL